MKKKLIYLFVLLSFLSCEKQVDWSLQNEQSDLIIVDGMITNEMKSHEIKLSYPVTQLNETPKPVSGATVLISDEDSTYHLTEQPVGSGIYKTASYFIGQVGNHYTLLINYNGKIYSAKTTLIQGYVFNPLQYVQIGNNGLYHITWIANAYDAENFAMYEILLDWSGVPGYQGVDPDSCRSRLLYYTLPTIDVSQVFAPVVEKQYFPAGTIITENRYTLTREHAEFIRALLSETNWQGGLFDSEHANIPTNLSDGAIGFFSACGASKLSITVTP